MILLLDDKSLSLVMRDAHKDRRKALKILREYYARKGRAQIINLIQDAFIITEGQ